MIRTKNLEIYKNIVKRVNNKIKSWDGKLIFVYIPHQEEFNNIISRLDSYYFNKNIFDFLDKEKIHLINLEKYFRTQTDIKKLYNGHFTKETNKFVSEILIDELKVINPT